MAQAATVRVDGYRELLRSLKAMEPAGRKAVRDELRKVGEEVRQGAAARFARYDARSAAGYKVRVRQRGIAVEQSLRKTTGKHPEFGKLQMVRALIPSLDANEQNTVRSIDEAMDRIAERVNAGGL